MANHHHINHLATAIGPLEFHAYEKGELLDLLLLVARELQLGKQTSKNVPIGLLHQELRIYGPLMEEHYAVQMDYAFSYLQEALDGGRLNSALTQKLFNLIRHREVGWESDAHEIGIIKCKVESIGADNHHIHHPGSHGVSLLQTPDNAFSDDVPNEEVMDEHVHHNHNHNHNHHHHHLIEEEFPVECPPISDDEKIRLLEEQTAWREELEQWEQHNNDEEVDDEDLEVEENEQAVEQDDDEQDDDDSDGDEPDYDEPDEDDEPDYDEPDYDEQDYDEPDDDEPDEDDELDDDEQQSDGQEETEQQAVVGTLHVVKQGMLEFNSSNMVITYNE